MALKKFIPLISFGLMKKYQSYDNEKFAVSLIRVCFVLETKENLTHFFHAFFGAVR